MPTISDFYGIKITMYFKDKEHDPPHFHAKYGSDTASFEIKTLNMTEGSLPPKIRLLVMEWAYMHQEELLEIWDKQVFKPIPPLK